jgi:hypothetical protein
MKAKAITKNLHLSIEDIDMHEQLSNLSTEQKLALISLVYDLSAALYNSESDNYKLCPLPREVDFQK